jgi:hypothetical protein
MGMSSYVMDCEDQFFNAAADVKIECDNVDKFKEIMYTQISLVSHMLKHEVDAILEEIWNE